MEYRVYLQQKQGSGGQACRGDRRTGAFGRSAGYRGSGTRGRGRKGAVRHDRCRGLQCRHRRTEAVPEYHGRGLDAHAGCQSHGYGAHDSRRAARNAAQPQGKHRYGVVHVGRVRRVLREPLFREQGCDHRPEQVARAGAWPEQYPGQLHCAGRDRHRHERHAQCGYHAGACRSDTARKSRRGSRGRGQHSVSVLG